MKPSFRTSLTSLFQPYHLLILLISLCLSLPPKPKTMVEFINEKLTAEESFWVMWYFLKEHYDLSGGTFDVADILGASEPIEFNEKGHFELVAKGNRRKAPIDSGMVSFWNEAIEKYRAEGMPPVKGLER